MFDKKINRIIIVLLSSFFYFLIVFFGFNLLTTRLPDSILMLSLYSTFFITAIYAFKYDLFNELFKKKYFKSIIIMVPIFLILIGLIFSILRNYNKNVKDPDIDILNNGKKVYEKADTAIDISKIDESLIYKADGNNLLSKDSYGNIRMYRPVYSDDMLECTYSLYTIDEGYIMACDYNKSLNYFTYTGDNKDPYYQLNINGDLLNNLTERVLTKLNINDKATYKKYDFDGNIYYTEQSYNNFSLLKQFNSKYYLRLKSWDIKKEIEKEKVVDKYELTRYYVKFISNDHYYYLAQCTIDDTFNLKINYIKQ